MAKSDYLRNQARPNVLGYDLARNTLQPVRQTVNVNKECDYGSSPIWTGGEIGMGEFTGLYRMVPSGDVVGYTERCKRLEGN